MTRTSFLQYKVFITLVGIALFVLLLGGYIYTLTRPPTTFAPLTRFEVAEGMTVKDIAQAAQQEGIVRSDLLLYTLLTYSYDPRTIYAGTYVFDSPVDVFGVAKKLAEKDTEKELLKLTIPEGVTASEIAQIASRQLPDFDADTYQKRVEEREGYLFPDTYFVPYTFTAEDLLLLQEKTFKEKIAPLQERIDASLFNEYEVLILASILEREAKDTESMKMVSGILQNRLALGMPLQADATIAYILDTKIKDLPAGQLAEELRTTDSPYNTYLYTGLPPTPIGNPGLVAIEAVLEPTPSEYYYYLTDENGRFYYAKTLQEHNKNIQRYLR